MKVYVSIEEGQMVFARARIDDKPRDLIGDVFEEVRPGEEFMGVPYEQLREAAETTGFIEIKGEDDDEE